MERENSAFITFDNTTAGLIFDDSNHEKHPIKYYNLIHGIGIIPDPDCSYYGFIYEGEATIHQKNESGIPVIEGMYFSLNGKFSVNSYSSSKMVVIEVLHTKGIYPANKYKAVRTFGGKIETEGRLKYIDGCTDSLLIQPVKMGDPCFNHLHFPDSIVQTPHTHPSHRIGIVADGSGLCVTPFGDLELKKGMIFLIKEWDGESMAQGIDGKEYEVGNHCFFTYDRTMDVVAFHPDSDFGAKDDFHPMINRTIVNGIPANLLTEIQTKNG